MLFLFLLALKVLYLTPSYRKFILGFYSEYLAYAFHNLLNFCLI